MNSTLAADLETELTALVDKLRGENPAFIACKDNQSISQPVKRLSDEMAKSVEGVLREVVQGYIDACSSPVEGKDQQRWRDSKDEVRRVLDPAFKLDLELNSPLYVNLPVAADRSMWFANTLNKKGAEYNINSTLSELFTKAGMDDDAVRQPILDMCTAQVMAPIEQGEVPDWMAKDYSSDGDLSVMQLRLLQAILFAIVLTLVVVVPIVSSVFLGLAVFDPAIVVIGLVPGVRLAFQIQKNNDRNLKHAKCKLTFLTLNKYFSKVSSTETKESSHIEGKVSENSLEKKVSEFFSKILFNPAKGNTQIKSDSGPISSQSESENREPQDDTEILVKESDTPIGHRPVDDLNNEDITDKNSHSTPSDPVDKKSNNHTAAKEIPVKSMPDFASRKSNEETKGVDSKPVPFSRN